MKVKTWETRKINYFILCVFLCLSSLIYGQGADSIKVNELAEIELKNGSTFYGKVLHYNPLDSLVFLNSQDNKVVLPSHVVDSVNESLSIGNGFTSAISHSDYAIMEKKWYIDVSAYILTTKNYPAGGIQLSAGYRYNRWFSVGGFIARDNYYPALNEILYPIGTEFTGFFLDQGFSPFYKLNIGYGFMFNDEEVFRRESKGGLMFNPSLGLRFTGNKYMNGYFSVGYRFQPAYTVNDIGWRISETRTKDIYYQRLTLRLGVIL